MPSAFLSPARLAANRANAQLSTGPTSDAGKANSSLNSLKTGLTGRTVLLPGDDAAAYQAHLDLLVKRFDPVGDGERTLVQSIADIDWRLARIPALEAGIYAVGRLEFAALFPAEQDEAARRHLVDAKTFLTYQRPLNNLSIQEARLRRQREKDVKALHELQEARKHQASAAGSAPAAERTGRDLGPPDQRRVSADLGASRVSVVREISGFGFDFSTADRATHPVPDSDPQSQSSEIAPLPLSSANALLRT